MTDVDTIPVIKLAEKLASDTPDVVSIQIDNRDPNLKLNPKMELIVHLENGGCILFDAEEAMRCSCHGNWQQKFKLVLSLCLAK